METLTEGSVEWGVACLAMAGHDESGDRHLVRSFAGGLLVGVVDGLGHGKEAARAAGIGITTLEDHAAEPVANLLKRCDEALRPTRGAVISLASLKTRDSLMFWMGVGNVMGVLLRSNSGTRPSREFLMLRGGVVGSRLPKLRAVSVPIHQGDTLVFATDGIAEDFSQSLSPRLAPGDLADLILTRHSRGTDDALVLVVRYLRGAA